MAEFMLFFFFGGGGGGGAECCKIIGVCVPQHEDHSVCQVSEFQHILRCVLSMKLHPQEVLAADTKSMAMEYATGIKNCSTAQVMGYPLAVTLLHPT